LQAKRLRNNNPWIYVVYAGNVPSRAAAICEILKRGLAAEGFALAGKGVKSKDFGILAKQKAKAGKREYGEHPGQRGRSDPGRLGVRIQRKQFL
jgi:hypothetical protein